MKVLLKILPELLNLCSDSSHLSLKESILFQYQQFIRNKIMLQKDLVKEFLAVVPGILPFIQDHHSSSIMQIQDFMVKILATYSEQFKDWKLQDSLFEAVRSIISKIQSPYQINPQIIEVVLKLLKDIKKLYHCVQIRLIDCICCLLERQWDT